VGGEGDEGVDMSPEGRELLRTKAERLGIPLVLEPDLASDVRQRLEIFDRAASGAPIKAFVNVGGSWVNLGTDAAILELKPGVNREMRIPPLEKRGLIQEMALRKIPIIHLLFVKGLAERFGLPWDPVPLPHPGEGFLAAGKSRRIGRTVASLIYLAGVFAGLAWFGAAQARLRASM
jgi:poly-gamma-glutamate system protein